MLMEQIVDGILAWHRIDSHGSVGSVDSTQENDWFCWYQQRVEVLWATVVNLTTPQLTMADRRLLYRTREALTHFFVGFDDPCVLVHGNLSLRNMLKDPKSDQLLAMLNPGVVLWAPREYDLFRLCEAGMPSQLLFSYLQRAPVATLPGAALVICGVGSGRAFDPYRQAGAAAVRLCIATAAALAGRLNELYSAPALSAPFSHCHRLPSVSYQARSVWPRNIDDGVARSQIFSGESIANWLAGAGIGCSPLALKKRMARGRWLAEVTRMNGCSPTNLAT